MSRFHDADFLRGFFLAALCALVLALSACGGGGSGGTSPDGTPPPVGGAGDPPPGGEVPPPIPAAWQASEVAAAAMMQSSEPAVTAIDGSGNAFALWLQPAGGFESGLMASRHVPGSGWSTPQGISAHGKTVTQQQVVVDANGNALAVWAQGNTLETQAVFSARFTPAGGWSVPADVSGGQAAVSRISLGMDAQGNAIAVWGEQQPTGGGSWSDLAINGARFTPAGGWQGASFYGPGTTRKPAELKMAMAPNGDAVLLYATLSGGGTLRAVNFDGADWTNDTQVDADGSNARYEELFLRLLDDRRAVAGWRLRKTVGDDTQVRVALRDDETVWGDSGRLDDDSEPVSETRFAMDASGGVLAVWVESGGGGYINKLVSRRLAPGATAWGPAVYIDADDRAEADIRAADQVSLMFAGPRAIVAWRQMTSTGLDIKARVFQAEAWGDAKTLDTQTTVTRNPSIAGNARGEAVVTWKQGTALPLDLWAVFFK